MNSAIRKILKWAYGGAVVAFLIVMLVSSGESTPVRICFGLMCAGAGFVTGALLAANFSADEEPHEAPGSGAGGAPMGTPPPPPHH
jgi:hypothetical protein